MIRILLVEDDKDLNQTVCRHLNAHNYQTIGVPNAADAFEEFINANQEVLKMKHIMVAVGTVAAVALGIVGIRKLMDHRKKGWN